MKKINTAVVLVNYHTINRIINIAIKYSLFKAINKVVIVNNDTNDDEKIILSKLHNPKIEVIFEKKNWGYSNGNNIGIEYLMKAHIKADYIIISNSDIEVDEITIQKVIKKFELFSEFGVMAPRMLDENGNIFPMRFIEIGYKRLLLMCFIKDLDKKTERYVSQYSDNIYVQSFLPGSFFICRAKALIDCGMFDPNVFLYMEEDILSKRMRKAGYKLAVIDNLYYKHNHKYSKETLSFIIKSQKTIFLSERYFFRKYLNASYFQIIYVSILENIFLCRIIIGYIKKKWLKNQ